MSYSVTLVNASVEKLNKNLVDEINKKFKSTLKNSTPSKTVEFCEWLLKNRLCQEVIINELQIVCNRKLVWNRHNENRLLSVYYGLNNNTVEYYRSRGFFLNRNYYLSRAYVY